MRTANFTAVLRKAHHHQLLDLFAKQKPQRLAHAFLKTRIMLIQAINDAMTRHVHECISLASPRPMKTRPDTHLPSIPIEYGFLSVDGAAARASFPRPVTYPICRATVAMPHALSRAARRTTRAAAHCTSAASRSDTSPGAKPRCSCTTSR